MEYGILAVVPAVVVIALALISKKPHLSLCIGIFIGATILSGGNPLVALPIMLRDYIIPPLTSEGNIRVLFCLIVVQGMARMLKTTGAGAAIANKIKKIIKTKHGAETLTTAAGFAFIYTEPCFLLGVVMRPITEAYNVAKIKLAYICDSLGCNMAALSPICNYAPYFTGLIAIQVTALGLSGDGWDYYMDYWVHNFYSILAILLVYFVCIGKKDTGKLWLAEKRADVTGRLIAPGDVPVVPDEDDEITEATKEYPLRNFVVPMATMLVVLFSCVLWDGNVVENGVLGAIRNCNMTLAIICGFIGASMATILIGASEKMFTLIEGFEKWFQGCCTSMNVVMIIALAWALAEISTALDLKGVIAALIDSSGFAPELLPAAIFLVGAIMSFATGSSWGTAALLMPVTVPICYEYGLGIGIGAGAAIAGGLFGDHCSPISDTTIKASMASGSDHMAHVASQLPYALTAGGAAFIAYLVNGLTNNMVIGLVVGFICAAVVMTIQNKLTVKKYKDYDFEAEVEAMGAKS